jgi:hypothetical protein
LYSLETVVGIQLKQAIQVTAAPSKIGYAKIGQSVDFFSQKLPSRLRQWIYLSRYNEAYWPNLSCLLLVNFTGRMGFHSQKEPP